MLPSATSLNGATIHSGSRCSGIDRRLSVRDERPRQLVLAEILRDDDREHAPLPARLKMRRLAEVRTARLDAVVRTDGNVERLLRVSIEVADEQACTMPSGFLYQPSNAPVTLWPVSLTGSIGSGRCDRDAGDTRDSAASGH